MTNHSMIEDDTISDITTSWIVGSMVVLIAVLWSTWYSLVVVQSPKHKKRCPWGGIPIAPGGIPLLGHALQYKDNPPKFLLQASRKVGPVFWINLAGKPMIVVTGEVQQQQIAKASERILSARQAVADIGFEAMLGKRNVYQGTNLHKSIIKSMYKEEDYQLTQWMDVIRKNMATEVAAMNSSKPTRVDFMMLQRRVMLRSTIDRFIGTPLLLLEDNKNHDHFDFLYEFMAFQERVEEATAKAAILPSWIALPLFLRPVQKERARLQHFLRKRLKTWLGGKPQTPKNSSSTGTSNGPNGDNHSGMGFWLKEVYCEQQLSIEIIAEYIIGLLFAAHKNPAIGATQAYLMLHEKASTKVIAKCQAEAEAVSQSPTTLVDHGTTLRAVCLETLRLTAHTIGGLRTAQEAFPLKGTSFTIPKGASVSLSHIVPHHSDVWRKSTVFDVTRPKELYENDYHFTTFSHGIHRCPGQQTALVLMQCMLAILLEEYDVKLPSTKDMPSIDFERGTLAQRDGPVMVEIKPIH